MRKILLAALTAVLGFSSASGTAAIVTSRIDFSLAFAGPINPLVGSFTLTYDNTANVSDTTNGLVVNSLNLSVPSTIAFSHNYDPNTGQENFIIGGSVLGVGGTALEENDFAVGIISNASGTRVNGGAVYSFSGNYYFTSANFQPVVITPVASAVPEPACWALMIGGMGLAGGMMRRRVTKISFA
ncbi:MAG: hypothetical protein EON59_12835 [Alphaproteobacteria bacterium]|nr:MAG: hypothetical protein EON59_12835 [Alphaproteobacteria bacterium]